MRTDDEALIFFSYKLVSCVPKALALFCRSIESSLSWLSVVTWVG